MRPPRTRTLDYTPDRGDLIWLDFDPQSGHKQRGHRPALVLSPAAYNRKTNLAIVCPITNQQKGYPFEVPVPASVGLTGCVLADHVKSLDWKARNATFAARAPSVVLLQVLELLETLLEIRT